MKNIFIIFIFLVAININALYAKNVYTMEYGNKQFYQNKLYFQALLGYATVSEAGTLAKAQIIYDSFIKGINIKGADNFTQLQYEKIKDELNEYSKENGTYEKYLYNLYNDNITSYQAPKKWETNLEKATNMYFNENKKEEAYTLFKKIYEDGILAKAQLVIMYKEGILEENNNKIEERVANTEDELRKIALKNNSQAQYLYGYYMEKIYKDYHQANELYKKAYAGGFKPAKKRYLLTKNKKTITPYKVTKKKVQASNKYKMSEELKTANTLYYKNFQAKKSLPYYKKALEKGDVLAKLQLAKMYYFGIEVEKNIPKATKIFKQKLPILKKLANQNVPFAQYLYGYLILNILNDININIDKKEGIKWYQKAIQLNEYTAQSNLATIYYEGSNKNIKKSIEKAVKLYTLAAQQGAVVAAYQLGKIHMNNKKYFNITKAIKWYKIAAEKDYKDTHFKLAKIYKNLGKRASTLNQLKKGKKQNYERAEFEFGQYYFYTRQYKKAILFYKNSINKDIKTYNKNARYNIALCYEQLGDFESALKWYTISYKQDHTMDAYRPMILLSTMKALNKQNNTNDIKLDKKKKRNLKRIKNYHPYQHDCQAPSMPSAYASSSVINRASREINNYNKCLEHAYNKIKRDFNSLLRSIDGIKLEKDSFYAPSYCQKSINKKLNEKNNALDEINQEITDFNYAMSKHNNSVKNAQKWQNIENSLQQINNNIRQNGW